MKIICIWFIFRRWNKGIIPLASYWRRGEFSKMLKTTNKETTNYLKFNFKRIKTSQLIWRSVRKLGVINLISRSWAKEWKSAVTQWCFMIWKVFLTWGILRRNLPLTNYNSGLFAFKSLKSSLTRSIAIWCTKTSFKSMQEWTRCLLELTELKRRKKNS